MLRVELARTHEPVAEQVQIARTWRARMVGLLAHHALPSGEALFFPACNSIHMLGMRFSIDSIFVSRGWRVVAIRAGLSPGQLVLPVWQAWGVLEASCGTAERVGLKAGDQLEAIVATP